MGVALLRKTIGDTLVSEAWAQAINKPVDSRRPCPICSRDMQEATVQVEEKPLVLDLCLRCGFMWFDATLYESIPPLPPKPKILGDIDEMKLPQEVRTALAIQKVADLRDNEPVEPDADWKALPAMFGMPVEMDSSALKRTPWATYLLSALIVAVSVWAFGALQPIVDAYGLIPAQAWRYHGLTFLTSFFLHGGIFHLTSNVYFLVVFGCRVEEFVGRWRWLLIVFLAAFVGDLLHIAADPRANIPCIGASGGISGLVAFYALKFPHAKLGYLLRFGYIPIRWIRFPAWGAFLLWVLLQVYGVYKQLAGYSSVSSLAHLGGLAVGVVFWWAWRDIDLQPAPSLIQVKIK